MEDMTRREYEHSRPLDVHRWSDHPEVLALYVAWSDDPNLNIAVHMSMNAYSDGTEVVKASPDITP